MRGRPKRPTTITQLIQDHTTLEYKGYDGKCLGLLKISPREGAAQPRGLDPSCTLQVPPSQQLALQFKKNMKKKTKKSLPTSISLASTTMSRLCLRFSCATKPTPHESFSWPGLYRPMVFSGSALIGGGSICDHVASGRRADTFEAAFRTEGTAIRLLMVGKRRNIVKPRSAIGVF